jgi:hypothetical protein
MMLLRVLDIQVLRWPARSPDLSPIENVWFKMKSWIELNYPGIQDLTLAQLRHVVQEAWDAIDSDFLRQLAHSMPGQLRKVIEKEGGLIGY